MNNEESASFRKKIKYAGIILIIIGLIVLVAFVFNRFINNDQKSIQKLISPIADFPFIRNSQSGNSLEGVVQDTLIGTKGTYGIVIKNLKTGESYFLNEHKAFESASLYKLWIMATAFDQIQKGALKEDEVLSEEVDILNEKFNIASESAEVTEEKVIFTVSQALDEMITISHNYASLLLSARVRHSSVTSYLAKNGFNESSLGEPPVVTPYDIALFFEKLYKGELASFEYTDKMLNLLKKQKLNSKLSKYLPNIVFAHKTGEIGKYTHDAGIVYSQKGDYIIVILTKSDFRFEEEERIAKISKAVYAYFENKIK
ncbi:MAG: serine hydrolase [bacterium]|nr:serine hydrolase [bacterium]